MDRLRSEKFLWKCFRTGVRLPSAPPRRRGRHIVRGGFFAKATSHSFCRGSSPSRTRFAGLRFGFVLQLRVSFFLVFMRVCGLFSVSKKDWCPITVIPVFRDICKAKRSFHLIFQAGNSAFLRLPPFFPVVGSVEVSGSFIDRLTNPPKWANFKPSRYKGVVRPFLEPLRLNGRGGFPLFPPLTLSPLILYQLGKNKITLSSNSARTSSFQQPTRKDE